MFSHVITRTALGTVLAATLLAPAAAADNWGRDHQSGLDPAIATALNNRAAVASAPNPLDPAIQAAILEHQAATPLDPAIQAALLDHQTANQAPARPDNRAGTHGPGSLPQPAPVATTSDGIDWNNLGFGAGATLGALLLALGSAIGVRHAKTRTTNA